MIRSQNKNIKNNSKAEKKVFDDECACGKFVVDFLNYAVKIGTVMVDFGNNIYLITRAEHRNLIAKKKEEQTK